MAVFTRHEGCEKCGSSDAKAVYNDGSTYCWNCTKTTLSDEYKELLQESKPKRKRKDTMVDEQKVQSTKPVIDPEDAAEIKANTIKGLSDDGSLITIVDEWLDDE